MKRATGDLPGRDQDLLEAVGPAAVVSQGRVGNVGRRLFSGAILWPLFTVLIFIGIWEGISKLGVVDPIIVPPFSEVMVSLVELVQTKLFWENASATVRASVAGFAIGCGAAYALGTLLTLGKPIRQALWPGIIAFQNTPRIIFAPLFLTWFGFGIGSKIVMSAGICFFPVVIAVVVGMETVNQDARSLMQSLGASKWETYRKLVVPSSLPIVFAGFKQGMTLAVIGAIVGEFVGASEGLGVLIKAFNFQLNVADAFAVIIALGTIGLLLYGIVEWIDRKVVFWRSM